MGSGPVDQVDAPGAGPPAESPVRASATGPGHRRWLLPLAAAISLAAIGGWVALHWGIEETDNAQLEADLTEISSRVPGTVERVAVQENQQVNRGELLIQLDPRDARAQVQQAEADLAAARREAEAMHTQAGSTASRAKAAGNEAQAAEDVAAAELRRAASDLRRLQSLVKEGGVSVQDVERARASYARAQGAFLSSKASRQTALASLTQVAVDEDKAAAEGSKVKQAEAALARARLNLSYTSITAPATGRIGGREAEPGRQVQPGQPLMTLVSTMPWVEANFKETQLRSLYPGQPAEVRLDAFPGKTLRGHVVSLAPASGSRFALLPPDNATGNFTKVVQRVSVRITLDQGSDPALQKRLVPGLSATVSVRRR